MPRIELDEIIPEDITFAYRGKEYVIPGDLDIDTTFDLIALLGRHGAAEAADDTEEVRVVNKEVEQKLLFLFRQRMPDLEALPFGVIGYRVVLAQVLTALGLQIVEEPETPPKPRRAKKTSPSRPSSGSPR